jgi:DNA repair exonuclease SbcCD nuclease subunit
MNRAIIVGDPHITVSNLAESDKLLSFIQLSAVDKGADSIIFMGDQFHTHSLIRVEVQQFWKRWLDILSSKFTIYALVGNHDMKMVLGQRKEENAMDVFKSIRRVHIIDEPVVIDGIGMCPYIIDHHNFKEHVKHLDSKILFAHQTFLGATFDNGFYAPEAVDIQELPFDQIISGHIHEEQTIGKCHYVGTPKWDGLSDANKDKGIWVFDFKDGIISNKEFISSKAVLQPIVKHVVNEGEDVPKITDNERVYLELRGSAAWITKLKKKYKGIANIKSVYLKDDKVTIDRESVMDINNYLKTIFKPIDGVSYQDISEYLNSMKIEVV